MHESTATDSPTVSSATDGRSYTSPIESLRGVARFHEETALKHFFAALPLPDDHAFLDVGCGYGRKMQWMRDLGINPTGVDINPAHIQAVRDAGMEALSIDEFDSSDKLYDGMLMSHIIEHSRPEDLMGFIDKYLDRLKDDGYLVIATPMPWVGFLEDFDHVRPYPPRSITQVFATSTTQVQYHGRSRLKLIDLALRRVPYSPQYTDLMYSKMHQGGLLWKLRYYRLPRIYRKVFKISGGSLGGCTTGWIGVSQKKA